MSETGKLNSGLGVGEVFNQAQKAADSTEYLVEGAKLVCVNGSCVTQLKLPKNHNYTSGGKQKANCKDCKACVNIPYFGECKKNEDNHQCEGFMDLVEKWENTAVSATKAETVGGEDAISMSSVLLCKKGGIIIPVTSGQGYDGEINWDAFLKRYQNVYKWVAGKNLACHVYGKDPINLNTGNYIYEKEGLFVNGRMPIQFKLFYNAMSNRVSESLGEGWIHNYDIRLEKNIEKNLISIIFEDGKEAPYRRMLRGDYEAVMGDPGILEEMGEGYRYQTKGGIIYWFDSEGRLMSQTDQKGNKCAFTYNEAGELKQVKNENGSWLEYRYNQEQRLIYVTDHTGRQIKLEYQYGKLRWFTNAKGRRYTYNYNENGKLNEVLTPQNTFAVKNVYDGADRIVKQTMPDGGVVELLYDDKNNRTYMKEENGNMIIFESDSRQRNIRTIYEDGEEVFSYNDKNQKILYTDKNGNTTRYAYDNRGNLTKVIDALGQKFYMTYDDRNHLSSMKYPNGTSIKNYFNEDGDLIETIDRLENSTKIEYLNNHLIDRFLLPDGSELKFGYDKNGNLTQILDPAGNRSEFTYNELGQQESMIDGNGNTIHFHYDIKGNLDEIMNPAGDNRKFQYNDSGKITEIKDFDESIHKMEYDGCNRCCKYTDPEGNVTLYEYDKIGKLMKKTLPNGGSYQYTYSHLGRLQTAIDPLGNTIKLSHDPNGNCLKVIEPNGAEISYAYDALNRLISKTEEDGLIINYEYNVDNKVTKVIDNHGNQVSMEYDSMRRTTKVTDVYGNCNSYSYDCLGQIINETDGAGRKTDYSYYPGKLLKKIQYFDGRSQEFWYDGNSNIIKMKNQDNFSANLTYDHLNRCIAVTDSMGNKKSYVYDKGENITSLTNANGNITHYEYSPNGNITKVMDALGYYTCYEYDCMGDLVSTIRKGRNQPETSYYQRNVLGKIEAITNALGNTEYYEYDMIGNMTKKIDRDGGETCFSYSLAGLLENIKYADGSQVTLKYDGLRRLNEIEDWLGRMKIEWGVYKQLKSVTDYKGRKVSYKFSPMGNLTEMTYSNGKNVKYSYDDCLRLSNLADGIHNIRFRYNKNGFLQEKIFSGSLKTIYSYNNAGQLIELINQSDKRILDQYCYSYDPVGNKTGINKIRTGLPSESGDFQYEYNPLNQLTRVLKNGEELREYSYDAFGNRISKKEGENETNYIYNANNQLIKEAGQEIKEYQYDLRGNLRTESVDGAVSRSYEFDARNHMEAIYGENGILSAFQYNGLGHRIGKKVHNGNAPIELEYVLDFTRRGNNLLEKIENGEEEYFIWDKSIVSSIGKYDEKQFLNDELGSTIRTYFSNGREAGLYGYDEFGEVTCKEERTRQPFGFTGYQWDEYSDTYYAQAREYCPSTGSFISEDVVNDIIGLPETLNHYGYCWGNPCRWVDINGQFAQEPWQRAFFNFEKYEAKKFLNASKDEVSNIIEEIGNGVNKVTTAVNEFWNNDIYGVDRELYNNNKGFSVKAHKGGGIIVAKRDYRGEFIGWYINYSIDIPNSNYSYGGIISGKNFDIKTWQEKGYLKEKYPDLKSSHSIGAGYNYNEAFINESWSGNLKDLNLKSNNISDVSIDKFSPKFLDGMDLESYSNITWTYSKDITGVPLRPVFELIFGDERDSTYIPAFSRAFSPEFTPGVPNIGSFPVGVCGG